MNKNAGYWIKNLSLEKHPEGGYFKEIYRSEEKIPAESLPERFSKSRSFTTSICFLLESSDFSAFHRLKSDEVWHFFTGSALTLHIIGHDGKHTQEVLGSDLENGEIFQAVVKARCWFAVKVNDRSSFSLTSCTVSPGFEFQDFELGKRDELLRIYPEHKKIIEELTR